MKKHFFKDAVDPTCWMTLEVLLDGTLSLNVFESGVIQSNFQIRPEDRDRFICYSLSQPKNREEATVEN